MLFGCKEYFLRLPGRVTIFPDDTFHQGNKLSLSTDAAHAVPYGCIWRGLYAMSMTHPFDFIRTQLNGRPITECFGSRDQILIPVPGMEGFLQFAERSRIAQRET